MRGLWRCCSAANADDENIERRKLLLALFALFVVFHALSFFLGTSTSLLISRIGIALTHAVFGRLRLLWRYGWLAPTGKTNQALGLLSTGTVLAMVLGIPLGRVVGQYFGWRSASADRRLCCRRNAGVG